MGASFTNRNKINIVIMSEFAGKYTYESQENFEEYLKAAGFNMVMRKAFANSKPEIVFEVNDGKTFKIQTTTTFKTMNAEFTLDESYENDITGKKETYVTTLEGKKLITKVVNSGEVISTRELTDSGFIQTYFAKGGVTATRTFKKV